MNKIRVQYIHQKPAYIDKHIDFILHEALLNAPRIVNDKNNSNLPPTYNKSTLL